MDHEHSAAGDRQLARLDALDLRLVTLVEANLAVDVVNGREEGAHGRDALGCLCLLALRIHEATRRLDTLLVSGGICREVAGIAPHAGKLSVE